MGMVGCGVKFKNTRTKRLVLYLDRYASHFRLHEHIELETRVQSISRSSDGTRWDIQLQKADGSSWRETFDKVSICMSKCITPNIPPLVNRDLFKGKVIHSQAFKKSVYEIYPSPRRKGLGAHLL
jgi:dimethylaniline monooxygenase (N-oxide forming)